MSPPVSRHGKKLDNRSFCIVLVTSMRLKWSLRSKSNDEKSKSQQKFVMGEICDGLTFGYSPLTSMI